MNKTAKLRNNCGMKKSQSTYDDQDIDKFWEMCDNKKKGYEFNPYKNFEHLLESLVFFLSRAWVFRGHEEPCNLKVSDISFERNEEGKRTIELKNLWGKKNRKLSLKNTSFSVNYNNKLVEYDSNQFCVVRLMWHYRENHLPNNYNGTLFL